MSKKIPHVQGVEIVAKVVSKNLNGRKLNKSQREAMEIFEYWKRELPYDPKGLRLAIIKDFGLNQDENYSEAKLELEIRSRVDSVLPPDFKELFITVAKKIVLGTYTEEDHKQYVAYFADKDIKKGRIKL